VQQRVGLALQARERSLGPQALDFGALALVLHGRRQRRLGRAQLVSGFLQQPKYRRVIGARLFE
jgi:hypothetical protein